MKITNKYGLPQVFIRAVENDPYDKGKSDFSATGLANPPRATALLKTHADKIEIDASSRVAAIIGQGTHSIAERAARLGLDLCEDRFFSEFVVDEQKYIVSAQLDLFEMDTGCLYDWKTTKAYAFSKKAGAGKKPEWIEQLNIGAEILRRNGFVPKNLIIIALLKDWVKRDAGREGMPESEVLSVELPMWPQSKVVEHIENRIRAHVAALKALPLCTTKETWGGNRCGQWCDASSVCEQYQEGLKTGILHKKAEGE
jgi:hypothetical protein